MVHREQNYIYVSSKQCDVVVIRHPIRSYHEGALRRLAPRARVVISVPTSPRHIGICLGVCMYPHKNIGKFIHFYVETALCVWLR